MQNLCNFTKKWLIIPPQSVLAVAASLILAATSSIACFLRDMRGTSTE